ncbi:MAG: FeoA domain-containing protein [Candidatus Calescibacterium sp.]|nr:FeoA domain-containing protein [Candidatus Calescibacterium sp.]MDW8132916.1 FeoA domain-containing protein [Candidatus Calescibacterium sp.]
MYNDIRLIFIILLFILVIILFKISAKLIKNRKNRLIKEKKEDILKFLYNQAEKNQETNFEKIQLFSKLKPEKLMKIINILLKERKIKYDKENIKLTNDGVKEAQEIIEKHRKIEKYLFESTSVKIEEIHSIAEKEEHSNKLNIELANTYQCIDPHGDVIKGQGVHSFSILKLTQNLDNTNKIFKIIHIEDEPREIYSKIVQLDIAPFDYIKIKEINTNSIKIITNRGQLIEIDFILAGNIFIVEEENKNEEIEILFNEIEENFDLISTLDKLKINQKAKILGLSFYIRGEEKRRLLELGFVRNSLVEPLYNNMLGDDPRVYKIKNTAIALRKEQAQKIYVQKLN